MRNVLMISPHFPPDSTAATHRVRLLAPHLPAHGWQPTVLTVDPSDYEGRLDPALLASVPPEVRVVRTRAWPASASRAVGVGDLGIRAFRGLWRAASALLTAEQFDAVFITIYPSYPALLGPLLKRRFTFAFVLDYQDPWVGEWGRTAGPLAGGRPDLKSRVSRFVSTRLEPHALEAADAVTAVSSATFEQALERTPAARPRRCAELPIGWDRRDLEFAGGSPRVVPDDGLVHLSYVGTLLPTGFDTLHAVLQAAAALRAHNPAADRLRLHFFGTSNQRTDSPPRVLPVAAEYGLTGIVTEHAPRLDYFEALRVLRDSTAVLLMGSRDRHYTPSKVYPALAARRPVFAVMHEASTASDLLRRVGRAPAVRLVTYGDEPPQACVDAIANELSVLIAHPCHESASIDESVLDAVSACSLAGTLAKVFEECLA
jgi:glycosyltransferase involved in cell wall biosynthesis